ncbi:MAG: hypothetical protein PHD37_07460 [Gallionellaceae bacterium]|nr:hypothetical protein [Gallionellaceae bacterium]
MSSSDIFRFMTIRAVQRATGEKLSAITVQSELPSTDTSHSELALRAKRSAAKMSRDEARQWAVDFVASPEFVPSIRDIKTPVADIEQWLFNQGDRVEIAKFIDHVKNLTGMAPDMLIDQQQYRDDRQAVLYSLTALALLTNTQPRLRNELLRLQCVFGLIEKVVSQPTLFATPDDSRNFLMNCVVVFPDFVPVPADDLARPPAIADLKVVRQELRKYEMGELADIENVLRGESKSRVHRRKDVRDETTQVTSEHEQTDEQDNQSTDRFEMQREVDKVVSDDMHFEAGVNISATYGPVSASANAGFEANHSQQESTRVATNYAHEVINKAAKRVRDRTQTQRTVRMVREVEETNTHGIDNTGKSDHMIGIYRYVDKVYEAQLYNYGRRLLLEFIVPEPGAFMKFAISKASQPTGAIKNPEEPIIALRDTSRRGGFGSATVARPLQPDDLMPSNYLSWVAKYFVQDAEAPPPSTVHVGIAFDDPAQPDAGITEATPARKIYKVNKEVTIPSGYAASHIKGTMHMSNWLTDTLLTVGSSNIALSEYRTGSGMAFDADISPPSGISGAGDLRLPIALLLENTWGYNFAAIVTCTLTADGLKKWQISTYEKIMSAYFELKRAYEEQVAAEQIRQGVGIQGSNPLRNRSIERDELKKNVIAMLEQHHFDGPPIDREAIQTTAPQNYPEVNFTVAQAERDYIQWFEQSFEWLEMTYTFYPYYWAKKADWVVEAMRDDTDPTFASFLRAGAARVVVPVRPGFESAMSLYLSTGIIWNGTQVPQVGDPLFVSIIQEIQEQLEHGDEGTLEDTWPVTVPTSLVILQETGILPT